MGHSADPAPVDSIQGSAGASPSPLREKMRRKVEYWRSLRTLSNEQQAALEFWEAYLARDRATLAAEREVQSDVSEPLQRR